MDIRWRYDCSVIDGNAIRYGVALPLAVAAVFRRVDVFCSQRQLSRDCLCYFRRCHLLHVVERLSSARCCRSSCSGQTPCTVRAVPSTCATTPARQVRCWPAPSTAGFSVISPTTATVTALWRRALESQLMRRLLADAALTFAKVKRRGAVRRAICRWQIPSVYTWNCAAAASKTV